MQRPLRAVVVGAGFGGLGAAHTLRRCGVEDVVLLERADAVGGTWRDNHYPGAACDIPAHLYSFSFAPKSDWTTHYPSQPEIRAYLEEVTDRLGLRPLLRLGTTVTGARFDEERACWVVGTEDGTTYEGEILVTAVGPLSEPSIPEIPGRTGFAGPQFHTARWNHDVDLDGRRVGVVGTGASAVQVVPHLAQRAAEVVVFQRSAPWVLPRWDRPYSRAFRWVLRHVPGARWLWRTLIYWQKELRFAGFKRESRAMRLMETFARLHLRWSVDDPDLARRLEPDHAMGCKRILLSSDYYATLDRDDVRVETGRIAKVTPEGVELEDGRRHDLDVLVWGTGFDVQGMLAPMTVRGLEGRRLADVWQPSPAAYLGTTVPGFPNLFLVLGPNTGLGHNSMVHVMESQYRYLAAAVAVLREPDVAYLDVRDDALERFRTEVDRRNDGLVWASGCRSWYLDESGHNFSLWPGFTFQYRRRASRLRPGDHRVVRRLPDRVATGSGAT